MVDYGIMIVNLLGVRCYTFLCSLCLESPTFPLHVPLLIPLSTHMDNVGARL